MEIENKISKWKNLTSEITETWIREYFDWDENEEVQFYWVNDDVGGIFEVSNYYFNFSDVLDCYKHNVTKEDLFKWYDFYMESQKVNISLARFIISPEERLKKEEEYLQELKERVILVENKFNKALNIYGEEEDTD